MIRQAAIALALAGCAEAEAPAPDPRYGGIVARPLDADLVGFQVTMTAPHGPEDLETYARCAVAGYTLIRGYGFARHLRTTVDEKGGVWTADAVYTISPALPNGLANLDAEVVAADCAENGIPTV